MKEKSALVWGLGLIGFTIYLIARDPAIWRVIFFPGLIGLLALTCWAQENNHKLTAGVTGVLLGCVATLLLGSLAWYVLSGAWIGSGGAVGGDDWDWVRGH